jgi:hypothetical protein
MIHVPTYRMVTLVELGLFVPTIQTENPRIPANHIPDCLPRTPVKLRGPQVGVHGMRYIHPA